MMTIEVRVLPAQAERVETGAVRFGDDWPGVFIRGDNAMNFAYHLETLLDEAEGVEHIALTMAVLRGLLSDLRSCRLMGS
jgi:hypothetical protein